MFSITIDTWSDITGECQMSVTGHYISAPKDRPLEWELTSTQLGFAPVDGNHSGKNLARVILRIIDRYDGRSKVCSLLPFRNLTKSYHELGWITADNASNMDTTVHNIGKAIDPSGDLFDPVQRRCRYVLASSHRLLHADWKYKLQLYGACSSCLKQALCRRSRSHC